jgi:hypothetical protein
MSIEGSGIKATETREVYGFDSVELAGVGQLIVRQNDAESLTIEGDDNIVPRIKTEVVGGKLVIGMEDERINPKLPIVYNVTVRDIKSLGLSGAGSVLANNLKADDLEAYVAGAGNMTLGNIESSNLRVSMPGAGYIVTSGNVDTQSVTISGAGRYRADELRSVRANVVTSGVGSALLWVTDTLSAVIDGVGSLQYYGSPQVRLHRSSMGSFTRLGDR